MFGHRSDGAKAKLNNGLYLAMPHIMNHRYDSMNMTEFDIDLEILDEFIKEQKESTGVIYSYLDIINSAIIRTIYLRPELNRFVVNRRIYDRHEIQVSMAVQKSLKQGLQSNETTIKIGFEGYENILEVKQAFEAQFREAKGSTNDTDKLTTTLAKIPYGINYLVIGMLKLLDKLGILPKAVMDAEPFHTTYFITDLRSVKGPSIYHHVYEFGTTGLFFSTGVEELKPYKTIDGDVKFKRVMPMKFVSDERFCDGLYFVTSLRMLQKILKNPKVLLLEIEPRERTKAQQKYYDKKAKAKAKKEAKALRQAKKEEKKNKKANKE